MAEIVKVKVSELTDNAPVSVAITVSPAYVPAVVGVPLMTPTLDRFTPAGQVEQTAFSDGVREQLFKAK